MTTMLDDQLCLILMHVSSEKYKWKAVTWGATKMFKCYFTVAFNGHIFIHRGNQGLIWSTGLLPSCYTMLYLSSFCWTVSSASVCISTENHIMWYDHVTHVQFSTVTLPQDVPHRKHINPPRGERRKEGGREGRKE